MCVDPHVCMFSCYAVEIRGIMSLAECGSKEIRSLPPHSRAILVELQWARPVTPSCLAQEANISVMQLKCECTVIGCCLAGTIVETIH